MPEVHHHDVVVVGAGSSGLVRELRPAGIDDIVVMEAGELGGTEPTGARWDEESRTWTVQTRGGDVRVARFLVGVLDGLDITGRDGRSLRATWAEHGVVTHLGITVSDFPNLFLLGPDPGLDRRTRYVRQAIETVRATGMSGLDVRAEVQQRSHAARVQRTTGPGATLRSWLDTRRFDPRDFELFGRAADASREVPRSP